MTLMRRIGLAIFISAGLFQSSLPAHAQTQVQIDIPALPMEDALDRFAVQARISLSLPVEGFGALRTRDIRGAFTVEEGLGRLLAGAPFRFEKVGPGSYRVSAVLVHARSEANLAESHDIVIVSARRPVNVDELPRDVTRIDGGDLAQLGATSDRELAGQVSGLAYTNLGMGRDKIIIRGLSDGALTGRSQSLAGIYLDDTRITYDAPDPDIRLIDVKGVEVLKGPQGALYGAGSLGGILHIESTPPALNRVEGMMQGSLEVTDSGDVGHSIDLVFNQPLLSDALVVRGVLYDEKVGGWIDNRSLDLANANSSHRSGGRITVLAQIDDTWSVQLAGAQQEIATRDSQYLTTSADGARRQARLLEPHDNDFSMAALTLRGEWEWANLTSATSVVRHQLYSRFDATGAFADFPVMNGAVQSFDETRTLSILLNETRLASASGAVIPWFVGVFYADGDSGRSSRLADSPAAASGEARYTEVRSDLIDELALFGEVTLPLSSRFSVSAGARLFRSALEVASTARDGPAGPERGLRDQLADTGLAPDLRIQYHLASDVMLYASAAEGYRGGGINTMTIRGGKSRFAIAIGHSCILGGARGRFFNAVDLVNRLE